MKAKNVTLKQLQLSVFAKLVDFLSFLRMTVKL